MTDGASSPQVYVVALSSMPAIRPAEQVEAHFRAIFEHEFDYVWNTLRRLGVPPRDLEDLTHEVFVAVHRQLPHYDSSRPLRPWLFAFGFRIASDYRRRAHNRLEILEENDVADAAPAADAQLAAREDRALVAAALDTLDLDRRAVFVLHQLDECPVPEIAASLGIPLNTAYSRLRLAREQFAKAWKRLRAQQDRP